VAAALVIRVSSPVLIITWDGEAEELLELVTATELLLELMDELLKEDELVELDELLKEDELVELDELLNEELLIELLLNELLLVELEELLNEELLVELELRL
jgi:hypothetical protein